MSQPSPHLRYKRSKFSTRLPLGRLYTEGHAWLEERDTGSWRVGFTKFALRMLGDPVEFEFEVKQGEPVEKGQVIGWVEGFKAVTDVFCPMDGEFEGWNPGLEQEIDLLRSDPYEAGWLYAVRGTPDEECRPPEGYVEHLDATIDRMLGAAS